MDYREILDRMTGEAKDFVNNPSKLDALLVELEQKLKAVPAIGDTVSELPVLVAMVKSWIKKEYQVSPKVLAIIVGAIVVAVVAVVAILAANGMIGGGRRRRR